MLRKLGCLFILLPVGLVACSQDQEFEQKVLSVLIKKSVPVVSPQQLAAEWRTDSSLVLLDGRSRREYQISHLPKAAYVGYDDFDLRSVQAIPKDAPIVVYCSVGYRSEKLGEKLIQAGYHRVRNLYGGLFEWVNEGNPVVDSLGQTTNQVHAYSKLWGRWLKKGNKVYQ